MSNLTRGMMMGAAGASAAKTYVDDVFSTYLTVGAGGQTIPNGIDLAIEGGMVWSKARNVMTPPVIHDTERGVNKFLQTPDPAAQIDLNGNANGGSITAWNNNGFTTGVDGSYGYTDLNGYGDFVHWTFRKAPGFFDVVTYIGDSNDQVVSHSLGSIPGCIIIKAYGTTGATAGTGDWSVYHRGLTNTGSNYSIKLNDQAGEVNMGGLVATDSTFTLYDTANVNTDQVLYVAYIFAHDDAQFGTAGNESIIKCGSFSGTGTTILGWEPQWLLIKPYNQSWDWEIYDNMRGMGQPAGLSSGRGINPNRNYAENNHSGISFESSGFTQTTFGVSYPCIYMAIRRPNKPPTVGTEVFNIVSDAGSASARSILAGNLVDLQISKSKSNSSYPWHWVDRKRGALTLNSSASDIETTSQVNGTTFDLMDGIRVPSGTDGWSNVSPYGAPYIRYFLTRASGCFDAVAYKGTGSSELEVHNLGVVPEFIIVKNRTSAENWVCYHTGNADSNFSAYEKFIQLNNSGAAFPSSPAGTPTAVWRGQAPTSTTFGHGNGANEGELNSNFIAYLFATLPGISKVGSYNGDTGNEVEVPCGFDTGARFILIKRSDASGDWYLWDSNRGISGSGNDPYILLNSVADQVANTDYIEPWPSGFKVKSAPAALNETGGTYIFLAIA